VKNGLLITQGSVADMLRQGEALEMRVTDATRAIEVLQAIDWVRGVTPSEGHLVVEAPLERAAELSKALADNQVYLSELRPRDSSLEDFFLEVTGEDAD